jgi:exodeoxyribonuclease III
MLLATWNVNSIRARHDRLLAWLEKQKPDVLCLQELKCERGALDELELEKLGWHVAANCQKTYNGVAILSRAPLSDVFVGMQDGEEDPQARLVAATVGGIRVISAYVPNGSAVGSDKYAYKLRWLERLKRWLETHGDPGQPLALCGDFNVAPEARDVHDPAAWENETLFHVDSRERLSALMSWGLVDAFRLHNDAAGLYSWWDYRMLGFPKNLGLRIDHVFVTQPLATRVQGSFIDRDERKGKQPSDHAPVCVRIE